MQLAGGSNKTLIGKPAPGLSLKEGSACHNVVYSLVHIVGTPRQLDCTIWSLC
jgi:hypothetical protein